MRLCGGVCTKSAPAERRKGPETWCKGNERTRFCGDLCTNPGPKKQEKAARAPPELALHCRQSLVPPLRGANILPWSAAGHRPSWRLGAGKALCLRYGAPTFYPEARPAAGKVRARLPAKPINSVFMREPRCREEQKAGPPADTCSSSAGRHLQLIRRPSKNNKKTSNLSCSSMVRDQGFEPWTP